LHTVLNNE